MNEPAASSLANSRAGGQNFMSNDQGGHMAEKTVQRRKRRKYMELPADFIKANGGSENCEPRRIVAPKGIYKTPHGYRVQLNIESVSITPSNNRRPGSPSEQGLMRVFSSSTDCEDNQPSLWQSPGSFDVLDGQGNASDADSGFPSIERKPRSGSVGSGPSITSGCTSGTVSPTASTGQASGAGGPVSKGAGLAPLATGPATTAPPLRSKFSRNSKRFDHAIWLYEIAILVSDCPHCLDDMLVRGNFESMCSMNWISTEEAYLDALKSNIETLHAARMLTEMEYTSAFDAYFKMKLGKSNNEVSPRMASGAPPLWGQIVGGAATGNGGPMDSELPAPKPFHHGIAKSSSSRGPPPTFCRAPRSTRAFGSLIGHSASTDAEDDSPSPSGISSSGLSGANELTGAADEENMAGGASRARIDDAPFSSTAGGQNGAMSALDLLCNAAVMCHVAPPKACALGDEKIGRYPP